MNYKKSTVDIIFDVFLYTFLTLLMVVWIYPIVSVFAMSFSSPAPLKAGKVTFYPIGFTINPYIDSFRNQNLLLGYLNTIQYAGVGTLLMLFFTSLCAYALSTPSLVMRRFFTLYWAIPMFFGGGLIPSYLMIKALGLIDTFWVMVLPGCVAGGTLFVFRAFFSQLPYETRESAYIDGANDIVICLRIILPLSKPLLATYALFSIVGHWNSWFSALLYLRDQWRMPLQIYLRRLLIIADISSLRFEALSSMINTKGVQMATTVIAIVPILAVYPFLQRYFVKGVMIGTIKG